MVEDAPLQEKEAHCPNAFGSASESNHLSATMLATNVHTMENIVVEANARENPMQNITPREVEQGIDYMNQLNNVPSHLRNDYNGYDSCKLWSRRCCGRLACHA